MDPAHELARWAQDCLLLGANVQGMSLVGSRVGEECLKVLGTGAVVIGRRWIEGYEPTGR